MDIEVGKIRSKLSGKEYTIYMNDEGLYKCECVESVHFKNKMCRHVMQFLEEQREKKNEIIDEEIGVDEKTKFVRKALEDKQVVEALKNLEECL